MKSRAFGHSVRPSASVLAGDLPFPARHGRTKSEPAVCITANGWLSFCRGNRIRTCDPLLPKRNLPIFVGFCLFFFGFVNCCIPDANIAILFHFIFVYFAGFYIFVYKLCTEVKIYTQMNYSKDGITVSPMLDTAHPKKSGKYPVKIRVTYKRARWYYSTGKDLTPEEWEVMPTTKARAVVSVRKDIESSYQIVRSAVEELAASVASRWMLSTPD
nr:MAG TPA: Arm DNA-binding domain protein [Caudoviricetes sp.]